MGVKIKKPSILKRLARDESGAFSLMWATAMTGIIISVGATYDLAQLTKAKALAQYAADNMALAASIAVDTDNDDRYAAGQTYQYGAIGAGAEDFTQSITGSVQYDIVDDGDTDNDDLSENDKSRLLARATVTGTYRTSFMGMVPGMSNIDFTATSDVAYAARQGTPASIFFVVDNSGSMDSRDDNYVRKISSLKTSMIDFMTTLNTISSYGSSIFRTALFPYNYNLISYKVVSPDWATLSTYDINNMYADGGTRSTSALHRATTKFALENQIHDNENGEDAPLKFLIFMSDGANNDAYMQRQCTTEQVWQNGSPAYWNVRYYRRWNRHDYWQDWFRYYQYYQVDATQGGYQDQQVCENVPYSPVNEASLVHCTTMKNAGVKIYSIAYDVAYNERALAEAFMKECSSGVEDYYKYASNGADLQAVFDEIGNAVVTEVIRVKH